MKKIRIGRSAIAAAVTAAVVSHACGQVASVHQTGSRATGVTLPAAGAPLPERNAERAEVVSVARLWNEELLSALRRTPPRPTVIARHLFHTSAAMYDAWAAFDGGASAVFRREIGTAMDPDAAREEAISYAAYRMIEARFQNGPGGAETLASIDSLMGVLGYDPAVTTRTGNSPAAIGNRIAASVLAQTINDGSNEANNYADTTGYTPFNSPLIVENPGTGGMNDINRWQPLIDPGQVDPQSFLTPHWRNVRPFAIQRPGPDELYLDPGSPPQLGGAGDATVRDNILQNIRYSGMLDPDDGVLINTSPALVGNNPLGTQDGTGHPVNPVTGLAYEDNFVLRGDFGRVLAEFWADGPLSTTPPGHWNEIANEVSYYPGFERLYRGEGFELSPLEWDIKVYLAINGGLQDIAIATWEAKAEYDFVRPISLVREMGSLGQSSDPMGTSYHPNGLPLEAGVVEVITAESSAPGERHEALADHIGEIAIYAWAGYSEDPITQYSGAAWILAANWLPYQRIDVISPPFPGYTSGHSGFSRLSAETLAFLTGSEYFPGGLGSFTSSKGPGGFGLGFEFGPSQDTLLEWATYFDAADEAGLSRIYGGIHPALDDFPGRIMGHNAAMETTAAADAYFNGLGSVRCPADFAEPFAVYTIFDILDYLAAYVADEQIADFDGNESVNIKDVMAYLTAWSEGCE